MATKHTFRPFVRSLVQPIPNARAVVDTVGRGFEDGKVTRFYFETDLEFRVWIARFRNPNNDCNLIIVRTITAADGPPPRNDSCYRMPVVNRHPEHRMSR